MKGHVYCLQRHLLDARVHGRGLTREAHLGRADNLGGGKESLLINNMDQQAKHTKSQQANV